RPDIEMMRLIHNRREIGKSEEGKMPVVLEPVALAEVADEIVGEYAAIAEQGQRTLRAAVHRDVPPVVADRWLLRRVLANLVVNAIRHSGGGGVVGATSGPHQGTLCVTDTGRGIAPEGKTLLFEKVRGGGAAGHDRPGPETR